MKIIIEPSNLDEPEVVIRGRSESAEVKSLLDLLGSAGAVSQIPLYAADKEYFFKPEEIVYFMADGGKTAAYVNSRMYEAKGRLYEIAQQLRYKGFVQINKSTIVNAARVEYVEVEFSGNYTAFLRDEKMKLTISRAYMKDFRTYIMEGR